VINPAAVAAPRRAADWRVEAALHPWLDWRLSTFPDQGWIEGHALDPRTAPDETMRRLRGVYYGLIAEVDAQIGRLLDRLDDLGRREETLVVVTADHGEMLGDHGLLGKEGWFDQAFHVPLIVRAPGWGGSAAVTAFTEQVDIMPTVLDWLGVPLPRACDGLSLLPWVRGERPARWRREAHWEFDFRDPLEGRPETALGLAPAQCCLNVVRGPRWKYVHFAGLPPLLFDLENDPWETINLYPDPQYRVVALEYAERLLSWRMTHDEAALTATLLTPAGPIESAFENDRTIIRRR
jgi:arylsulfatase A-like enzyme